MGFWHAPCSLATWWRAFLIIAGYWETPLFLTPLGHQLSNFVQLNLKHCCYPLVRYYEETYWADKHLEKSLFLNFCGL